MKPSDTSQFSGKSGKIFYVIFIPDEKIRKCIDAIRFIASSKEKYPSHITVRGPYKRRISVDKINARLRGNIISISGIGSFSSNDHRQNTVYFTCDGNRLRDAWRKKDFGYEPHITLYDGEDFGFAEELYDVMKQYYFDLKFSAEKLEVLPTFPKQRSFEPNYILNDLFVKNILNNSYKKLGDLEGLTNKKKIIMIRKLCEYLSGISLNFPISKALNFN